MRLRKIIGILCTVTLLPAVLAGCGTKARDAEASAGDGLPTGGITVISREEGSGTRGAFIELLGIEKKDADGIKIDHTTEAAEIANSTNVVMTSVAGNERSIGYISLGSLNDTVKALRIDGVDATAENILNSAYKIARPFNIATKGEAVGLTADFIKYVMSDEGQKVVTGSGYISKGGTGAYTASGMSGKIVVAGSSSVSPLMEKLIEGYAVLNPNAAVELQTSDSTTGMTSALEGVCDIGMASRELKDSELSKGLVPAVIATDGIAVIVNNNNGLSDLTRGQVAAIYTGEITRWQELG